MYILFTKLNDEHEFLKYDDRNATMVKKIYIESKKLNISYKNAIFI